MNATNPQAVAARIRMAMPSLTPREGRVVTVMVGMTEMNESTSLRDVASDADVSDAMVVKIAKKLGFTGFRQMRAGLIDYNRSDSAALFHELSPDDDTGQIIEKVFRTSVQALEETMAIIDVAAFERAASLLAGARHRDFYGIGGSAQIARDVALCATARGSALLSENAAARIAQLNVLDALFVAVTNHDTGAARQNLERTMAAVDGKRLR